MAIDNEIESKNEDLDLCSVRQNGRDKSDTVKRERRLDWLSKPRSMVLLHKESFAKTRSRASNKCRERWGRTEATQSTLEVSRSTARHSTIG